MPIDKIKVQKSEWDRVKNERSLFRKKVEQLQEENKRIKKTPVIEWQPIQTADRKTGSKILCYGCGYIFEAEYEEDDGYQAWCSIGGHEPTHWMPLPDPPNECRG